MYILYICLSNTYFYIRRIKWCLNLRNIAYLSGKDIYIIFYQVHIHQFICCVNSNKIYDMTGRKRKVEYVLPRLLNRKKLNKFGKLFVQIN